MHVHAMLVLIEECCVLHSGDGRVGNIVSRRGNGEWVYACSSGVYRLCTWPSGVVTGHLNYC